MKAKFDELLPFYVNGSLSQADRDWVDEYLREHPKASAELRWYESLQAKLRDDAPAVSSEVGLERALQRIRTEGPAPQGARRAAAPSLWSRLGDFIGNLVPQPVLKPAFAGALALVAVQGAVIVTMMANSSDEDTELRAVRATVTDKGPYLKLNFKADAREADMRMLLVQSHGSLVAGPGQLGDYYVRVPAAQAEQIAAQLKSNPIVEGVAVVDALPARP